MTETVHCYKFKRNGTVSYFGGLYPSVAEDWDNTETTILFWETQRQ